MIQARVLVHHTEKENSSVSVAYEFWLCDTDLVVMQHNIIVTDNEFSASDEKIVVQQTEPKWHKRNIDSCKFLDWIGDMNKEGRLIEIQLLDLKLMSKGGSNENIQTHGDNEV